MLVYRPTRKVGRAEKLLHWWHGPNVVIRQITTLNYEVQLPGGRKSEVVQVKRMVRFVDDTALANSEEGAESSMDETVDFEIQKKVS